MIHESVESTVPSTRANVEGRPWHIRTSRGDDNVVSDGSASIGDPSDVGDREAAHGQSGGFVGQPLWRRVLTGKSIGWRVRSYRNKARARARRAARRPARVLQPRPDIRRLLEQGRWLSAARLVVARPQGVRTRRTAHGVIVINASVDRSARRHPLALALLRPAEPDGSGCDDCPDVELTSMSTSQPLRVCHPVVSTVNRSGAACVVNSSMVLAGDASLADVVDERYWNPSGFPQQPTMGERRVRDLIGRRPRTLHAARGATALTWEPDEVSDTLTWARVITDLAAAGAPLWTRSIDGDLRRLLGEPLAAAITCPSEVSDLRQVRRREMHSVAVRRAALGTHAPRARWSQVANELGSRAVSTRWEGVVPTISILLATRRPDDLAQALEMISRQRHPRLQLVVGLHGASWTDEAESMVRSAGIADVRIRRFDSDCNLGDVLAGLAELSDGEFVTKWDDDDWYDADHIGDLLLAADYSGADLVGKAAEFVRLESIGLTIRRFARGAESMSTTIAGGTLLLRRSVLDEVGGWPSAVRQVDRLLIDRVLRHHGSVYRTHGFGYVLRRRSDGHTWSVDEGYFLRQSTDQRRGLDLEFAGIEGFEDDAG
jgi:hypothetical protein